MTVLLFLVEQFNIHFDGSDDHLGVLNRLHLKSNSATRGSGYRMDCE